MLQWSRQGVCLLVRVRACHNENEGGERGSEADEINFFAALRITIFDYDDHILNRSDDAD